MWRSESLKKISGKFCLWSYSLSLCPNSHCPRQLFTLFVYRANHFSRPSVVVFFFSSWTKPHQNRYVLQSHKGLVGQAENTLQFSHRNYNYLMFGQFKMCVLFHLPLSFIFPKQEQRELILNFHLPVTCYFHLSIEEYCQKVWKQHLVWCRTGWLAYVTEK